MVSEKWIILTCVGRSTLRLASSLGEDGFEVWAPSMTLRIDVPRMNAKRTVTTAILPGFVFAGATHLHELLEIERMPVKPRRGVGLAEPAHADFSLFRHLDRIRLVADVDLEPLRRIERRRQRPTKADRTFEAGRGVKATSGIYAGLPGIVRRSNDRITIVCLGGLLDRVEIPTSILADNEIITAPTNLAA